MINLNFYDKTEHSNFHGFTLKHGFWFGNDGLPLFARVNLSSDSKEV